VSFAVNVDTVQVEFEMEMTRIWEAYIMNPIYLLIKFPIHGE